MVSVSVPVAVLVTLPGVGKGAVRAAAVDAEDLLVPRLVPHDEVLATEAADRSPQ